jgi:hypothetical protein
LDGFEHAKSAFSRPQMAIPNSASGRRHDTRPLTLYRHRSIDLIADTPSAMDALPDILRCDDHEPRDFRDEETVKQFVRPIRWLSVNVGERRLFRLNVRLAPSKCFERVAFARLSSHFYRFVSRRPRGIGFRRADPHAISRSRGSRELNSVSPNIPSQWLSTGLAVIVLWAFVIVGLVEPRDLLGEASEWKTWVSQNFTWLYIAAFVRPQPANAKSRQLSTPTLPPGECVSSARRQPSDRARRAIPGVPKAASHPRRVHRRTVRSAPSARAPRGDRTGDC